MILFEEVIPEIIMVPGEAVAFHTVEGWHVHFSPSISPNGLIVVLPTEAEVIKLISKVINGKSSGS